MWIRFLIVLSSICAHLLCEAQNILKYKCLFKTGDDMEWSQIGFDDADWDQIIIGKPWEHQGWEGYDGYAWYRQKVAPKTEIKKSVEQAGGLQLLLGKIDDVSAVFWNGEKLGGAGTFPPNYQTGYNVPIEILIPFDKINWKAPNVLSIRVYDGGGFGGIIGEAIKLSIPGVPDALAITPRLSSDHQFLTTGPIVFSTQIANNSQQAFRGQVSVSVVSDFGQSILKTSEKKRIPPKKHIDHKVDLGKLGPGFYQVEITLESDIGQAKKRFSIGVRPEDIWSPTNRPDDFQTYWEKAKNELSCIPPQYKLIKLDSLCTDQKEVFLLEMRSLGNVLVRAWYSKPLRPGPYPAIVPMPNIFGGTAGMIWRP
ncbi:MAG: acetylxylan esterase [Cyclobacteriaceae bacterium]|nr:acetylxylan esterase [Cyclobacteriaceae bacterium HetDA_MAG_MS6]